MGLIPEQDLRDFEEVMRNLRQRGFYVFER